VGNFRNQIPRLLNDYLSCRVVSVDDQSHGYANQNYRVVTEAGKYFVRVCMQQSIANVEQEIILMSLLKDNAFKTAYPLSRKDGDWISFLNDIPVVVYDFVEGELPLLSQDTVSEIARATARLSLISCPDKLTKRNAISLDDSMKIIGSEAFINYSHRDVTDRFEKYISILTATLREELPQGIVHGDIFPDNTLFLGNRLAAIIDFEEFAIDTLLFDAGMTINGFCFDQKKLDQNYMRYFLKSYNSIRQIDRLEREFLVDYMAWGAVGMTSWHLHQLLNKKNRKQLERVRVLLGRAEWILDNRLLLEEIVKESL